MTEHHELGRLALSIGSHCAYADYRQRDAELAAHLCIGPGSDLRDDRLDGHFLHDAGGHPEVHAAALNLLPAAPPLGSHHSGLVTECETADVPAAALARIGA
ncbi:hypothetical protein [Falsiroseomonas sp. E2-1-a20]|uniref:hypothetical protein n=1 Tax=Falsiroseomonas sp. E2-1-a20 TaxID=3239300 RepID=UPI003F3DC7F4